jgi:hypothetical protein
MDAFVDFISQVMLDWITEGIHEVDCLSDWVRN